MLSWINHSLLAAMEVWQCHKESESRATLLWHYKHWHYKHWHYKHWHYNHWHYKVISTWCTSLSKAAIQKRLPSFYSIQAHCHWPLTAFRSSVNGTCYFVTLLVAWVWNNSVTKEAIWHGLTSWTASYHETMSHYSRYKCKLTIHLWCHSWSCLPVWRQNTSICLCTILCCYLTLIGIY